jgi:hypothetical protein
MVGLIVFLKVKGYPLKILLKRTIGWLIKEKFLFGISTFGVFKMLSLVSGELYLNFAGVYSNLTGDVSISH